MRGTTTVVVIVAAWAIVSAWGPGAGAARAAGPTGGLVIEPAARQVGRFERIDLRIGLNLRFRNPHDPGEADVQVELRTPSGAVQRLPAFWYQPYERRKVGRRTWTYPQGPGRWMARFAPAEVGTYRATAVVGGKARSEPATFECVASRRPGFVRVSKADPRYLEHDDGTPYFAIGHNVAFVKDVDVACEMIRRIGAAGGNFARVWACAEDWALAIEARRSAFGRSWAWNPPIAMLPDKEGCAAGKLCLKVEGERGVKVEPTRPVSLRPGTRYALRGKVKAGNDGGLAIDGLGAARSIAGKGAGQWAAFEESFETGAEQWFLPTLTLRPTGRGPAYVRDLSLREAGGDGPELLAEADVDRPALGVYNEVDAFELDQVVDAAEAAGVRLQLCLLTRDHYMGNLVREGSDEYARATEMARRLLRYAVARWGYSTSVLAWEYFNEMDPGRPTERFYQDLGEHLEKADPYRHLRVNSTWHSPSKDFRHPKLDVANLHHYLRPPDGEEGYKDEVAVVRAKWPQMQRAMTGAPRPLMFAEFGVTDQRWQRARELDADKAYVHWKRALWASMLSGYAGTVAHWYWDDIHRRDLYGHYAPVAAFAATVPWNGGKLRPADAGADAGLGVVGVSDGAGGAWLWVYDPRARWWDVAVGGKAPQEVKGATVSVRGLGAARGVRVEWWDTATGKVVREERAEVTAGEAKLVVPAFAGDIACRVVAAAGAGRGLP